MHEPFMRVALDEARLARSAGEVPVGAVVVMDGAIIGRGHNASLALHDPSAHAEVLAMRDAASRLGNYRLVGATLYCTVEPCLMCLGTTIHARVARLVYGATDLKVGAVGRLEALRALGADFNHRVDALGGLFAEEAAELLLDFFRERRESARAGAANVASITERYRSGRNGGASKALCLGDQARGFESHPLRQFSEGVPGRR
jgi:tRNA(adenine34) deaminase